MNMRAKIMNLQRGKYPHNLNREDVLMAYRMGYRDARHDAADLANTGDSCIEALRAIVEQQRSMGFDGSPSDELMDEARRALAAVGAA